MIWFLALSVLLSTGRNLLSKATACITASGRCNESRSTFFRSQTVLFLSAECLLLMTELYGGSFHSLSQVTIVLGILYGLLLLSSQWMYTLALSHGSVSVCSVIYSMGFLLPTLAGLLFWNETWTAVQPIGILLGAGSILLTLSREPESPESGKGYFLPLLTAMLSSGGLGILQKLQQSSMAAEEKGEFLIIAFFLAAAGSASAFLLCHKKEPMKTKSIDGIEKKDRLRRGQIFYPALAGLCFGGANTLNTTLAGKMSSAAFFPVQNLSVILLCTLCGLLFFKERPTCRTVWILLLGSAAVLTLSLS